MSTGVGFRARCIWAATGPGYRCRTLLGTGLMAMARRLSINGMNARRTPRWRTKSGRFRRGASPAHRFRVRRRPFDRRIHRTVVGSKPAHRSARVVHASEHLFSYAAEAALAALDHSRARFPARCLPAHRGRGQRPAHPGSMDSVRDSVPVAVPAFLRDRLDVPRRLRARASAVPRWWSFGRPPPRGAFCCSAWWIPVSLLPKFFAMAGNVYLFGALALGLMFLWAGVRVPIRSNHSARQAVCCSRAWFTFLLLCMASLLDGSRYSSVRWWAALRTAAADLWRSSRLHAY